MLRHALHIRQTNAHNPFSHSHTDACVDIHLYADTKTKLRGLTVIRAGFLGIKHARCIHFYFEPRPTQIMQNSTRFRKRPKIIAAITYAFSGFWMTVAILPHCNPIFQISEFFGNLMKESSQYGPQCPAAWPIQWRDTESGRGLWDLSKLKKSLQHLYLLNYFWVTDMRDYVNSISSLFIDRKRMCIYNV